MKHNLRLNCLRRSIVPTLIDIAIAATISVSLAASAQSSSTVINREAEFFYSSPDPLDHFYDADRFAKSGMPEHDTDIVESGKRDYDWSSSTPSEFAEGSVVRPSVQPAMLRFGGIPDVVSVFRAISGKSASDHPRPRPLPRLDRILLVGVAAVRLEDAVTTPLLFKNGAQEDMLPDSIARSHLSMLALGALATSAQYRVSAVLIRHNHGRIARATELIHIVSVGYFATQNIPAHAIYINR